MHSPTYQSVHQSNIGKCQIMALIPAIEKTLQPMSTFKSQETKVWFVKLKVPIIGPHTLCLWVELLVQNTSPKLEGAKTNILILHNMHILILRISTTLTHVHVLVLSHLPIQF